MRKQYKKDHSQMQQEDMDKLYEWCLVQREDYKNGELSSEKIKLLKDINFVFDEKDALYRSFFYSDRGDNKNYTLECVNKTIN